MRSRPAFRKKNNNNNNRDVDAHFSSLHLSNFSRRAATPCTDNLERSLQFVFYRRRGKARLTQISLGSAGNATDESQKLETGMKDF